MTNLRFIPAILMLLSIAVSPLLAQSQSSASSSSDEWQYKVAPYLMLPWMDGTVAIKGHEVKVNVAPSEILSSFQFGAMGYFEARKGKWAFGADAAYLAVGTTVDVPPADIDFNQGVYTFTGIRELNSKVDLLFGARWNVISARLGFKGPQLTTAEDTRQWVDPIVGIKLKQPLRGNWHFAMQADIGGFGAASGFAWEFWPMVGLDMGKKKNKTFGIGYRVISGDYETGSGTNRFKYDVITQGLVIGAAFHF